MPLTVSDLSALLLNKIAPGSEGQFLNILNEADERLLNSHDFEWTRTGLELTQVDGVITLPVEFQSIVGAKVGNRATGVRWQEIKYLEGGPSVVPVEGAKSELVDIGFTTVLGVELRAYEVIGKEDTFTVLAKYAPVMMTEETDQPKCQSISALKQAMYGIIYEEQNDIERSMAYFQLASKTLKEKELSYRGSAKKIFDPTMAMPMQYRRTTNFR